ncbi:DUF3575 domain-containing protein [Aquimarina sp. LLG6339-5]|uniref:DUF3575 domain-containing protein n=1 Tax=Aquimarina sp. LLG6339-5 TaxID=3160830 RepID=UPI00386FAA94
MRKKVLFQIVIAFTMITIHAQEAKTDTLNTIKDNTYKNSIRVLPLPTLFGLGISLEYERLIKNNWSLNIQAFGASYNSDIYRIGSQRSGPWTNIVRIEVDGRYYLLNHKKAPKGWFVGPGIIGGYKNVDFEEFNASENRDYDSFIIGGVVKSGYQWIFKNGFTLGAASGLASIYKFSGPREASSTELLLEFSIGYSW